MIFNLDFLSILTYTTMKFLPEFILITRSSDAKRIFDPKS